MAPGGKHVEMPKEEEKSALFDKKLTGSILSVVLK